jgi:HK97 gp10 family phage protein
MSVHIEIIGVDRVKTILTRIEQGMDPNLRKELDVVADKVKEDAKGLCPVDTGSLRKSIRKEAVARPTENIWEVGVRAGGYVMNPKSGKMVDYAKYVEFGTSGRPPRAFLRPAMRMNQTAVRDAVQRALIRALKEAKT